MKEKLYTTKEKSAQMSRVHLTGGKDGIIIRKLLWHGYEWEKHKPRIKRNREFWINKIVAIIFILLGILMITLRFV